jgi:uncharacterized membrane protein
MLSTTFIISYVTLLVTITIGYWLTTHERPDERFLSLSTLGKNGTAGDYYPANNYTNVVLLGQKVSWHIYVYNHAESAEYVSVRISIRIQALAWKKFIMEYSLKLDDFKCQHRC